MCSICVRIEHLDLWINYGYDALSAGMMMKYYQLKNVLYHMSAVQKLHSQGTPLVGVSRTLETMQNSRGTRKK